MDAARGPSHARAYMGLVRPAGPDATEEPVIAFGYVAGDVRECAELGPAFDLLHHAVELAGDAANDAFGEKEMKGRLGRREEPVPDPQRTRVLTFDVDVAQILSL